MENISDKMPLSDIRNLLETISEACDQFQMVSLTRQMEAAQALLSRTQGQTDDINSLIAQIENSF